MTNINFRECYPTTKKNKTGEMDDDRMHEETSTQRAQTHHTQSGSVCVDVIARADLNAPYHANREKNTVQLIRHRLVLCRVRFSFAYSHIRMEFSAIFRRRIYRSEVGGESISMVVIVTIAATELLLRLRLLLLLLLHEHLLLRIVRIHVIRVVG